MPRLLLALTLGLTLAACDFEQVIELDVPPYEPRLVLGGFPTPDSVFTVRVGRSASALTPTDFDPLALVVDDARLALFDADGTFLDSLYQSSPFYDDFPTPGVYRSLSGLRPEPGRSYTLRVDAPGLPSVRATTRLPEPITFAVRVDGVAEDVPGRGRIARVVVTVPDPPGPQAYALGIQQTVRFQDGTSYVQPLPFSSVDQVLRESFDRLDVAVDIDVDIDQGQRTFYGRALLRDATFAGTTRQIPLDLVIFDTGSAERDPVVVTLAVLDDDYVRYQQTLALQDINGDNPFAEPVRIHSNVEGGLGVFAGYAGSSVVVDIE
ncbi:MAG: DUF4249 domain-containing protein [Rhodothermales bacterium]